jgi:hypothetical protein
MRICIYHSSYLSSKERNGIRKKESEKKSKKSTFVQKERQRKERKRVVMLSKEAREGKLLKGVPHPSLIPHTCTS